MHLTGLVHLLEQVARSAVNEVAPMLCTLLLFSGRSHILYACLHVDVHQWGRKAAGYIHRAGMWAMECDC